VDDSLTHFDDAGAPRMVDVSAKPETARIARARAVVHMEAETLARIEQGTVAKGDVLAVARLAGITAAKRTSDLIPLCHPLRLTSVDLSLEPKRPDRVVIESVVRAVDRTGVEMEALVAASTAALTVYDMCKAMDRWMTIEGVQLLEKSGGKSGDLRRPPARNLPLEP
jgi:cyclic pyranopterin phosphate synthase